MSDEVLRRDDGAVRWLTLNRPRAANAIDTALADALAAELAVANTDDSVRAVALTGAGERVFCAGVDIRNGEPTEARRRNLRTVFWSILDFPKPLLCAINGVASGGGCMLAMLTDQRVIAETTWFVLPEIDIGIPTFPGLAIFSGLAGDALAADLVLSGRRLSAAEAQGWGLAIASPAASLTETTRAAADALAAKPAETYRQCKVWLNARRRTAIEDATAFGARPEGHS